MKIAAIDYSTFGCDTVTIPLDGPLQAEWTHTRFPGITSLARTRNVRDQMPARGYWTDAGVVLIAIERPYSRSPQGLIPLTRTLGAILACLPTSIDVWELSPPEWRRELGMRTNARRDDAKHAAARWAADHWPHIPSLVTGDACDAFCIAHAARLMLEKAAARKSPAQTAA